MNIAEIREFITENEADSEVKAFIDSLSDKRVNQARKTWENEIPKRVDTEIAARQERERQADERRVHVSEQLGDYFAEAKLQPEWVEPFLPDDLATIEDDQIPEIAGQITERVQDLRQRLLTERYTGTTPKGGGNSGEGKDPEAAEFRKAMGLN